MGKVICKEAGGIPAFRLLSIQGYDEVTSSAEVVIAESSADIKLFSAKQLEEDEVSSLMAVCKGVFKVEADGDIETGSDVFISEEGRVSQTGTEKIGFAMSDSSDGQVAVIKLLVGGSSGEKGDKGDTGAAGTNGTSATITGATATGLPAGATPTVTAGGTATARSFAFGIPAGAKGDTGAAGTAGVDGFPTEAQWDDLVARVAALENP